MTEITAEKSTAFSWQQNVRWKLVFRNI